MISRHPIFTGFHKLTGCQRDSRDRGVTLGIRVYGLGFFFIMFRFSSFGCSIKILRFRDFGFAV